MSKDRNMHAFGLSSVSLPVFASLLLRACKP